MHSVATIVLGSFTDGVPAKQTSWCTVQMTVNLTELLALNMNLSHSCTVPRLQEHSWNTQFQAA